MKNLYKQGFPWRDMLSVFILDILIFIVLKYLRVDIANYLNEDNLNSLFSSLIGTWGSLLGFVITGLSILLTIKENEFIKALKESGHYISICYVYLDASIWLGIATIFSIIALLFNGVNMPIIIISSFLYPLCIFKIGRCLQFLKRIIEITNK